MAFEQEEKSQNLLGGTRGILSPETKGKRWGKKKKHGRSLKGNRTNERGVETWKQERGRVKGGGTGKRGDGGRRKLFVGKILHSSI